MNDISLHSTFFFIKHGKTTFDAKTAGRSTFSLTRLNEHIAGALRLVNQAKTSQLYCHLVQKEAT